MLTGIHQGLPHLGAPLTLGDKARRYQPAPFEAVSCSTCGLGDGAR
jgi:hypothetical protein